MKPCSLSWGWGISIVNEIGQVTYGEPVIIQRYITNPLLLNGFKFDLRIYVTVTSFNPLEAFIYQEGFARLATSLFSLNPHDLSNKFIHLTNYSIQKNAVDRNLDQFNGIDQADQIYGGCKISLASLRKNFIRMRINYDDIWAKVEDIVLKTLVCANNEISYNPCCFELFGFDIIIDDNLDCHLIEVNSSPSLARDTLLDDMIKQRLIDETIDLVDVIDYDRKRLFEVLEWRIQQDNKQSTSVGSAASSKLTMNRDLTYILHGQQPWKYGEMPLLMGMYKRIAPTKQSEKYIWFLGGEKWFGSANKILS